MRVHSGFVKKLVLSKAFATAFGLVVLAGLAACAVQPPPYGPKTEGSSYGYTDEQLGANRYRVTYTGTSATPRETVEDYLLFRAAQVTLDAGFVAFEFDTRDTKAHTTYYSSFNDWPDWGWHRPFGWYWHSWPYDMDAETRPVTRYEAYAEIVMLTAEQAKAEPRSLDAHDVIARLGPRVLPPGQAH